MYIFHP
jgi:hypothetical protein